MERRENLKLDLVQSVIEQMHEDTESGSFEPIEELIDLIMNDENIKYFIGYLGNYELINKYNELLK